MLNIYRPDFEARTARANADAEGLRSQRPGGRRHAAQRDYLLHMGAAARGDRSFDQTEVRILWTSAGQLHLKHWPCALCLSHSTS
jgi:hypothetical protein